MGEHAFERTEERSILQQDLYRILRTRTVQDPPALNENKQWEATIVKKLAGTREAGAVTIVYRGRDKLFVKTVMWVDHDERTIPLHGLRP